MATNEDKDVSGTDFIGHDAASKYLLLKVPSYEDSGASLYQPAKDTYLNLGRGIGAGVAAPTWWTQTITSDDGKSSAPAWTADGLDSNATTDPVTGDDLLVFFQGFIDDKRLRGTGGTFEEPQATPPNESVVRSIEPADSTATPPKAAKDNVKAPCSAPNATPGTTGSGRNLNVTAKIPDYVGWRDHTDGHRVTTTRGDKIEIIGGNYKIVSLGRGQGIAQYEMSGGIIVDGDEPPGSISSVTWRPCPTDSPNSGWKVVEQVVTGNTVERFHGTKREEFYGNAIISVTGSPDENTSGIGLGVATDKSSKDGADESITPVLVEPARPANAAVPSKWDESGGLPPKLQQPDVYESTWAKSVTSYTRANSVTDGMHVAGAFTETLFVTGRHTIDATYDEGYASSTHMHGAGRYYVENWHMMLSGGFVENFYGAMTQNFFGASTTLGLANRFEIFLGLEEQLNLGGFFEMKIGKSIEVMAGAKSELGTESLKFWLAKEDTTLSDTVTRLNETSTLLSETRAVLSEKGCGLSRSARFAMIDF